MQTEAVCGREPRRGKDLQASLELELLGYMHKDEGWSVGQPSVTLLRNFIFTRRYIAWVKQVFDQELTQADFEAALRGMYRDSLIEPVQYKPGSVRKDYDAREILRHVEVFVVTSQGRNLLKKYDDGQLAIAS